MNYYNTPMKKRISEKMSLEDSFNGKLNDHHEK